MLEKMLPVLLLIIVGCGLIIYAFLNLKKADLTEKQLNDIVAEAKLVQHNLKLILNETKYVTDVLVDQVQRANKLVNELPAKGEQKIPKTITKVEKQEEDKLGNHKRQKVRELWQLGFNVAEIAQALAIGKGEVELYINLLNKEV